MTSGTLSLDSYKAWSRPTCGFYLSSRS